MWFVIKSDVEDVCKPGDIVTCFELENILKECSIVVVECVLYYDDACFVSEMIKKENEK